jgi:hypothetical protein
MMTSHAAHANATNTASTKAAAVKAARRGA